jgi:ubiquinone/menaquinone biosynthesis C-methylase UbiE
MTRDGKKRRFDVLRADPEAIRDFFNRVGPWFYTGYFSLMGYRSSLKYFWRQHCARVELREEMRILDAGIGTGFLTISLMREAPISLNVTGLDFSSGMLVGLKRNLRQYDFEIRVQPHVGDMCRMPFPDESFDLVMTSEAMEYLPDVRDGISECARVLRPGGQFLFIATKNSFMGKLIAATWRNKVLDPAHVRDCMMRAGIGQVENLRFPWYFKHVDATVMALLGKKAELYIDSAR